MADKRRRRIPQPWLWVLAGAALVFVFTFVFAVAPSLIIGSTPKGLSAADELKARNDIRTNLVQALAGLAVAGGLVVTYRTYRLNRAEQDRTYERELYAEAVEQLGHEKAPVRLGALYSLERLAQDKPERRPTVVDVICAYLRMPFSLTAPASKLESAAVETHAKPDTRTETRTDELGDTWRQERQVRLTAQRILANHLREERTKGQHSADPPSSRFWSDIRLDLGGATLIDFNLENCVIGDADFGGAAFSGPADFGGATFSGTAIFERATFSDTGNFSGAAFSGGAGFGKATFSSEAWFGEATFGSGANFSEATFGGSAGFRKTAFTGGANFGEAAFGGGAGFGEAAFGGSAWFGKATFSSSAWFGGATFGGNAWFGGATFGGNAWFGKATFSSSADSLNFGQSRVLSPAAKHNWPTNWRLESDSSGGCTVVRVDDTDRS
jgi:uncharacterized protein YjbI with pentapeptide repeats